MAAMMMIDDGAKAKSAESPRRKKEWNYKEATSIKIVAIVSSTQPSSTLIIERARGVLCMGPQFHSYRTLFSAPFLLPNSDLFFYPRILMDLSETREQRQTSQTRRWKESIQQSNVGPCWRLECCVNGGCSRIEPRQLALLD